MTKNGAIVIGLVVPVWKRYTLTRYTLRHWQALQETLIRNKIILIPCVVKSNEDDAEKWEWIDRCHSFHSISVPNEPRSDKFNAGYKEFQDNKNLDGVLLVGSDDVCTAEYIIGAVRMLLQGHNIVMATGLHFYNLEGGASFHIPVKSMGAFSLISRGLLEGLNFSPMDPGHNEGADKTLHNQIAKRIGHGAVQRGFVSVEPDGNLSVCVDIKSRGEDGHSANVWSFSHMATAFRAVKTDHTEKTVLKAIPWIWSLTELPTNRVTK